MGFYLKTRKGSYFVDAQYSRMFESVPVLGSGQQ
jgi:hypothetical protein